MSFESGEYYIDTSRIKDLLVKNNFLLGMGFNGEYAVIRATVVPDKLIFWDYDPIVEGLLSSAIAASTSYNGVEDHTYITPQRPKSVQIPSNPQFIFTNEKKSNRMYQIFFGISSSDIDVLFNQPFSQNQITLPVEEPTSTYNQYGYIPGKSTPIDRPGPGSQIWVPPNIDFAIGFRNTQQQTYKPLIRWVINYFEYEIVKDPDVIYEVLTTNKYGSLKTVGGVQQFKYNIQENMGAPAFSLGMSKSEIQNIVGSM